MSPSLAALGLALSLPACGPDLARLETEQQSLEQEVAVLRRRVDDMHHQVQAMGAAPGGPGATASPPIGADDLADRLRFVAERTGAGPVFAPLGAPERRPSTGCGYRFATAWLAALSDPSLDQIGLGRASPLVLSRDGKALEPHAGPVSFEKTCRGGFRHLPNYVFFAPDGMVDDVSGAWSLALAPDVPLPRSDGRPMYWVYPGTTLVFRFATGWEADWGPMTVHLDARVLPVGTPDAPSPRADVAASASVLGFTRETAEPSLGFEHTPAAPTGPWTIEVASPEGGPYVLLSTLVVGNAQHSLVVTVEPSGAAAASDAGDDPEETP